MCMVGAGGREDGIGGGGEERRQESTMQRLLAPHGDAFGALFQT